VGGAREPDCPCQSSLGEESGCTPRSSYRCSLLAWQAGSRQWRNLPASRGWRLFSVAGVHGGGCLLRCPPGGRAPGLVVRGHAMASGSRSLRHSDAVGVTRSQVQPSSTVHPSPPVPVLAAIGDRDGAAVRGDRRRRHTTESFPPTVRGSSLRGPAGAGSGPPAA